MKNLTIIGLAVVIFAGIAATASASEHAVSVPNSTLASMGFASAHQLSDTDGLAVRGKGTTTASYGAKSSFGSAIASSLHIGNVHHLHFSVIIAGGNASASAH